MLFYYVGVLTYFFFLLILFFFQAEDGIRDLVRSRGLGDVYKRQHQPARHRQRHEHGDLRVGGQQPAVRLLQRLSRQGLVRLHLAAVSYTHLTLPTSDLV